MLTTIHQPITEIELITPARASEYLARNTNNREVRRQHVETRIRQIKSGQWRLTHQGIAFDKTGVLIDGQHRLMAIAESGDSVQMLVTRGLHEETAVLIDVHHKRSLADRLRLVDNGNLNKHICRALRAYITLGMGARPMLETVAKVEDVFLEHPEEFIWIATHAAAGLPVGNRGDLAAAIFTYRCAHPEHAQDFMSQYVSGANLDGNDAILHLRNGFIEKAFTRTASTDQSTYWKVVRATQAHERGEKVIRLGEAREDWLGNQNLGYIRDREARGAKMSATAKARRA